MPPTEPAIAFDKVTKRYPGPHGDIEALREIDLTVHRGELFGLLGPNGAGKTTSIETIAGLRVQSSGQVRVLGLDPARERDLLRRKVSIQPQRAAVFQHQTVAELLTVWGSFYPQPRRADELIDKLGLTSSRNVRISKLSGGQQQRVLVGLALIGNPELLVLDEPSTGMDPNARQELWAVLREYQADGGTILLSTHSMEEAEQLCDRVAVLYLGALVALGTPAELIRQHAPGRDFQFTVDSTQALDRLTGVATVIEKNPTSRGTRVRINSAHSDSVIKLLGGPLNAKDIEMKDVGLDGVFRQLTGHAFDEAHPELTLAEGGVR